MGSLCFSVCFPAGLLRGEQEDVAQRECSDSGIVLQYAVQQSDISALYCAFLLDGSLLYVPRVSFETHVAVFIKAVIVLSSWIFGYFALKHLPLTLSGPIKATQPVLTLVGALVIFGERLNLYQWIGVAFAVASFYLLSVSGKKEGIRFTHNKWIYFILLSFR